MKNETRSTMAIITAMGALILCLVQPILVSALRTADAAQAAEIAELREAVVVLSMEIGAVEDGVRDMLFPPECSVDVTESEYVPSYVPVLPAEEIDLLERIVAAEARGGPYDGLIAVAEVILNRAELWGMSVTEVINAPGQFAEPYRGEISGDVKHAVGDALAGIRVYREPITHFHAVAETPGWAAEKNYAGRIGNHKFYW